MDLEKSELARNQAGVRSSRGLGGQQLLSPGEILLTQLIRPNNLTVHRVAKDSGIS